MINEPLVSTGILNYEKGSNFIWTQETPFKQIYLINEKAKNKFDEYINKFIISIITGEILNDKKLEVIYSQNNDKYMIIMTPKQGRRCLISQESPIRLGILCQKYTRNAIQRWI